ncbi:MAG: hypothetical protein JNN00_17375 [Chitinophagaceae bacterium]|nr:hypothetical protein [Chitinophagaceae bacterium]
MNTTIKATVFLLSSLVFEACSSPGIVTTWKVPHQGRQQYDKIMTVAVFRDKDDSLRAEAEDIFVKEIEGLSYQAVPAYAQFGLKGLAGLDQAETYFKLCHNGIDAVMTIALIDDTKETFQKPGDMYEYPASHYYNRVWNYQNISISPQNDSAGSDNGRFWEIILFDLNTLEAVCVMQTKSFTHNITGVTIEELGRQAIRKLHKEKVLTKGRKNFGSLRPF